MSEYNDKRLVMLEAQFRQLRADFEQLKESYMKMLDAISRLGR